MRGKQQLLMRFPGRFTIICMLLMSSWWSAAPASHAQGISLPGLPPLAADTAESRSRTVPPSERYGVQVNAGSVTYDLGPVQLPSSSPTAPLQVGVDRQLHLTSATQAQEFRTADDAKLLAWVVKSPAAVGLRVRFTGFNLAPGDELYVRSADGAGIVAGPYRGSGPWKNGEFLTPTIDGDTAVIEYHAKSGTGSFAVAAVSHIFQNIEEEQSINVLSCQIDATCSSVGPKNSVARIRFNSGSGTYVCTGTLLNNSNNDRAPYFLTANHCVGNAWEAQTVEAFWLYQTSSCNGVLRSDWIRTDSGAELLATSTANDSSLLRLFDPAPAAVGFSGWSTSAQSANTTVTALHHPGSSVPPSRTSHLRFSEGVIATGAPGCSATGLSAGYRVNWTSGTTEPGSSGSGIWVTTGGVSYLVGVLSCGSQTGTCAGSYDFYGRFSSFYPSIAQWLNPAPVVALPEALDAPQVPWTSGGTAQWRGQTATTRDGVDAAESGLISHNQETWVQTAVTGPGTLTFWWKVSSEAGYDLLSFRMNGAPVASVSSISGEVDWQQRSVTIPAGTHTLRWTYQKDGSVSTGADRGWLDLVRFPAGGSSAKADFNSDGDSDLVWENLTTGQRAIWLMNGAASAAERFLPNVATSWSIAATGDFNRDGHTDIVWQNNATGQRAIWLMNDTTWVGEQFLPTIPLEWQIAATGDFNADGHTDIVWQNIHTGHRAIWLMNGTTWVGEAFLPIIPVQWRIAGAGDFNRDGHTDLLWENHSTGQRAIWLMNGTAHAGEQFLPTVSDFWRIGGTGDFNGDGRIDIVWQNTSTGQRAIWLMNGTAHVGEQFLPTIPVQWSIRNH
jgi:hypothetical protein